ncbi:hypothetical protein H9P43_002299 [Blastocladiella emersonii ATCC 22665]|nr:hypothetical protein H9P43_002299 [Blastocladiella emersonii ATCC 22665]
MAADASSASFVKHILVVAFHHTLGPCVEWAYPPLPPVPGATTPANEADATKQQIELPAQWAALIPFCALPDGAHAADGAPSAFHLPPVPEWDFAKRTVFATAYYRQINASELKVKTPDITRPMVQKAVVVLTTEPVYGGLKDSLEAVTAEFFAQRDFTQRDLLVTYFASVQSMYTANIPACMFDTSLHLGQFIDRFRAKALVLYKLVLLQKRVMFFSTNVADLIHAQYALMFLFPSLVFHLHHTGSPDLAPDSAAAPLVDARIQFDLDSPSRFTDAAGTALSRRALFQRAGFPVPVFPAGSLVQPYLPLQQLDAAAAATGAVLFGSTNAVLRDHRALRLDAVVLCDGNSPADPDPRIEILNPDLAPLLALTPPDKKWVNDLAAAVADRTKTVGGDNAPEINELVRSQFEEYTLLLLATVQFAAGAIAAGESAAALPAAAKDSAAAAATPASPAKAVGEQGSAQDLALPAPPSGGNSDENLSAGGGGGNGGANDPNDPNSPAAKRNLLAEYNTAWVRAWLGTSGYTTWSTRAAADLHETVDPGHPCHGHTLAAHLNDKLHTKIAELNLDAKKQAVQAHLATAVTSGSKLLGQYAARVKEEAAKRQQQSAPAVAATREEIAQKTSAAASKAKAVGVSIWGAASAYIATKRAEYNATGAGAGAAGGVHADEPKKVASASPVSAHGQTAAGGQLGSADSMDSSDGLVGGGPGAGGKHNALSAGDDE